LRGLFIRNGPRHPLGLVSLFPEKFGFLDHGRSPIS
jgi:hypothetical protein